VINENDVIYVKLLLQYLQHTPVNEVVHFIIIIIINTITMIKMYR